jgi:20S proteasome subunit alpha 4
VEYIARYIAPLGVWLFGITTLLAGFVKEDEGGGYEGGDKTGAVPDRTHSEWKAQVIGGWNAKSLQKVLEKNWEEGLTEEKTVRMVSRHCSRLWAVERRIWKSVL